MTAADGHLSRLQLDRFILSPAEGPDAAQAAHVESCPRCRHRVEQIREQDQAFLQRFPSAELLERAVRKPEPASFFSRFWAYGAVAAAAAAAVIVAVVLLRPSGPPSRKPGKPGPTTRVKGGSIIEVAIKRQGRSFTYSGQPLREGDVVAFRYTTQKRFLLVLSLEASGKINVFLADAAGRRSMAIMPGVRIKLDRGIELDDYPGPERLIAILTDEPLETGNVRSVLEKRYKSLPKNRKMGLQLGRLPFRGEVITWLIVKERR